MVVDGPCRHRVMTILGWSVVLGCTLRGEDTNPCSRSIFSIEGLCMKLNEAEPVQLAVIKQCHVAALERKDLLGFFCQDSG